MRKVIFWLHLFAGSAAGIVILIMSVSGILLTYERQIITFADRDSRVVPPSAGASRLTVDTLLRRVSAELKAKPSSLLVHSDPKAPAEVGLGRERTVLLNPYTGAVLEDSSPRARGFFRVVEDWHRWLGRQGPSRAAGRTVTGVCNLAFLMLVISGLFLWLPKQWTWKHLRPSLFLRSGLRGKARDWNWHNAIGFWCALPLLFIVTTGVIMSFPWANNLLYRITGTEPPAARVADGPAESTPQGRRGRASQQADSGQVAFDPLWARAEQQVPDWKSISLRLPDRPSPVVSFSIDQSEGGHPDKRSQLTVDGRTGNIVRWEPFASYNAGRKLRAWARFMHTGEAGGIVGQTVAGLASSGAAFLVWTGISLALRRLRAWRSRTASRESLLSASK